MPFIDKKKFSPDANGKYSDFVDLGSFKLGIVNRVNDHNLPLGALLEATNVDIDNQGKVKRRKNYKKIDSSNCGSLFSDSKGVGYMLKDNVLVKINPNFTFTIMANGFPKRSKLSYCEVNGEIYYSDSESITGKINSRGSNERWCLDSPQTPPICNIIQDSGNIKAGRYLVTYTYLYGSYETGCSAYTTITVPYDGCSVNITTSSNSFSTNANIYITPVNSEVAGLYGSGYIQTIYDTNTLGRNIKKETATGFPALENLSYNNGRIFGTKGNYIYWTLPLDYRQFDPTKNGMGVDSDIQIFVCMQAGAWVVTKTTTYFLRGTDMDGDIQLEPVLPYGAIKGTLFYDEDKQMVGWLSNNGYIVADANGKIDNLTGDTVDFPKNYSGGAALFRKEHGIKQVIFSMVGEGADTSFSVIKKKDN